MTDTEPTAAETPPGLPAGVVTFLFSDIEGSTRMLEAHRAATGAALARHHELLAAAVQAARGAVFETVGDAVYGAFSNPADALAAAAAIHQTLAAADWGPIGTIKCRVAVHTGTVEQRDRHYFGAVLFECARLQALAHGGQTLTSAATAALARDALPAGLALRPLGPHRLKDLAEPMDVIQVDAAGLPNQFPPLRAAENVPNNLPAMATQFIGRDPDLERLAGLCATHRLVTLLGPGGTGKTRLALETAALQLPRFPDGVWFADLAPVFDPLHVVAETAQVWGLRAGEGSSIEDVLLRYLSNRHLLLVLDNCEHVRDAAAALVSKIVRVAPRVVVLATSRESLGVAGEVEYRVTPLSLPEHSAPAEHSEAVRFFVDRMRAIRPDLDVTPPVLDAITRICRRLDGMPLGLELAAARLRALTPADLAVRLDDSFKVLGSGNKSALPRQRSLDAAIGWSHGMLSDEEQAMFRRLAVFAGGFDVAAAEAVCEGVVDRDDVLERLDSLVDKSLIVPLRGADSRFRLLEPIRQYARDRLREVAEEDVVLDAHARHFAAFMHTASPHTRGAAQMTWDRRIDLDIGNLRVALRTLLATRDFDQYLDLCFAAAQYWWHTALHVEAIDTLLEGLARAGAEYDPLRRAKAWFLAAWFACQLSDRRAVAHAREGLGAARVLGDPSVEARLLLMLGGALNCTTDDPESRNCIEDGWRLFEAHPEPAWWEPEWDRPFVHLLVMASEWRDNPRLAEHVAAALDGFERTGDRVSLALSLGYGALLRGHLDDDAVAAYLERSVQMLATLHSPHTDGHARLMFGRWLLEHGARDDAGRHLESAMRTLEEIGDLNCWSIACRDLAAADVDRGATDAARRRLATAVDALPHVLSRETATCRILAIATGALLADGRVADAAFALGAIGDRSDLPVYANRIVAARADVESRLGADAARYTTAGAAGGMDAAVQRIAAWLRDGASGQS